MFWARHGALKYTKMQDYHAQKTNKNATFMLMSTINEDEKLDISSL